MRINIIPKDPKLAKRKDVKKYCAYLSKAISKQLTDQHFEEKVMLATGLGVPLLITKDGAIQVVEDLYSTAPQYRTKEYLKGLIYPHPKPIVKIHIRTGMPKFQRDYKLPRDPNNDKVDLKKYEALGKSLKHFKPGKRSKLSYRGDHYE
jgi:hypothetical protein